MTVHAAGHRLTTAVHSGDRRSTTVNAAGHRSTPADHSGDRRSTVAVNDGRRWRTTVDCRWTTVDHHWTTGQRCAIFLAVASLFFWQWQPSSLAVGTSSDSENSIPGSGNALCILFPTILL
nr:hypothetical protein [Tanacetum cinerariifolium]